jgi:hypothetical protein
MARSTVYNRCHAYSANIGTIDTSWKWKMSCVFSFRFSMQVAREAKTDLWLVKTSFDDESTWRLNLRDLGVISTTAQHSKTGEQASSPGPKTRNLVLESGRGMSRITLDQTMLPSPTGTRIQGLALYIDALAMVASLSGPRESENTSRIPSCLCGITYPLLDFSSHHLTLASPRVW